MPTLVTTLYALVALVGAAFAAVELRMLARFLRHREAIREAASSDREGQRATPAADGAARPTVTIQLPIYNERTATDQIIEAAARQDYPRDLFDIQVLDDSTDETTAIAERIVQRLRSEGVRIRRIHRTHRTGYKAGALAAGLQESDAEFVAVFDADFVPEPDFLRRILVEEAVFADPKVAFAQGRWAFDADRTAGWLARTLALLLDRHFRVQKPVRAWAGNVTTFNGSGGIWRRAAIDDAGGWTSDTLTEDLDLSYRCALAGWAGRYVHDVRVRNQLPMHMRAFKLQQRRWARGNAQCFRKLTRSVMRAGPRVRDRWDEMFMLAGYAIHPLLLANLLLWPWAVLHVNRLVFLGLQALMSLGVVAAGASFLVTVRERDGHWTARALGDVVAGLCVGMALMVNNTLGQVQGFLSMGGEFGRTPKAAVRHADQALVALGADRPYASPLHWTFFAELLVMAYCAGSAVMLVREGEALWSLALVFWAACLALIAQQQVADRGA
jgi:glycosyltransferase involved in cell wall biosynthesis